MNEAGRDEARDFWNHLADDWRIQVGDEGDENRRLNSDPVLWRLAGDVTGLRVLDAGCGTGYLARKLRARGARVTGVDVAERMVEIARSADPSGDFRVDSCEGLTTLGAEEFDLVVSNYVLMDTPDLDAALAAFHRVLKPAGAAVVIFSHPCFPQGRARVAGDRATVSYDWPEPYFEPARRTDPPWGHFTSEFIWWHRPLSDYWRAFVRAGFAIEEFDEPGRARVAAHASQDTSANRPCSVAFRLRKTS
jgi:SAM-dependent methyltransferase